MIVYIAGPMTGKPEKNWQAFAYAQDKLEKLGCIVLNPAVLPDGMPTEAYMPICISMVQQADAVYCLPGWVDSLGATTERQFALYQNKLIFESLDSFELQTYASMNFGKYSKTP